MYRFGTLHNQIVVIEGHCGLSIETQTVFILHFCRVKGQRAHSFHYSYNTSNFLLLGDTLVYFIYLWFYLYVIRMDYDGRNWLYQDQR
jgi:hypothetical protein